MVSESERRMLCGFNGGTAQGSTSICAWEYCVRVGLLYDITGAILSSLRCSRLETSWQRRSQLVSDTVCRVIWLLNASIQLQSWLSQEPPILANIADCTTLLSVSIAQPKVPANKQPPGFDYVMQTFSQCTTFLNSLRVSAKSMVS